MTRDRFRLMAAWIVGIMCWLLISSIFDLVMKEIGIPAYIDFGETIITQHRYYEEEKDGTLTTIGTALYIIAAMIASRIGMAINSRDINGGISKKGNIAFLVCSVGILIYGIQGAIFFSIFEDTKSQALLLLLRVIDLANAIGIFLLCKRWHDKEIQKIDIKINRN